jgi:pimeloyl-ACP methyl ester carboxylesterase
MTDVYQAFRSSHSHRFNARGLAYHFRTWGEPQADEIPWVMLHGWMDVGASFQFVIDQLQSCPFVVAPDWRGFGLTPDPGRDHFSFVDYLCDLDLLLDHLQHQHGHQRFNLIGHSMGGNVALLYAGLQSPRVHRLVNLEGFGLPATRSTMATERLRRWMKEVKSLHEGQLNLKPYDSLEGVAQRLIKTNPRLPQDKARWLAKHWAEPDSTGRWSILGSAAHKVVSPQLYQVEEVHSVLKGIEAPTLCVHSKERALFKQWGAMYTFDDYLQRMSVIPGVVHLEIEEASHMLHHDQPQVLANALSSFFTSSTPSTHPSEMTPA